MEMPVVKKDPPKAVSPRQVLEDHALDIYGEEKFDPLKEMLEYYKDETNKDALRFRALEKMLDKVYPVAKPVDEVHDTRPIINVLGKVDIELASADPNSNVVSIVPNDSDTNS